MRSALLALLLISAAFSFACSSDPDPVDSGTPDSGVVDSGRVDTGVDSGVDGGVDASDAGSEDLGVDGGSEDASVPFPRISCATVGGNCFEFEAGEEDMLIDAVNNLASDTTLILGAGTFNFDNAVTIRSANTITLTGQGIDITTLDFSDQTTQSNGVDVIGDDFTISYLTIADSKKDGLRVEDSTDVVISHVKATWTNGPATTNGSYGLYPVRCTNVLMENSEAYNASDAGLYVGQSINVIVRDNIAQRNVAGLEIENTQYADVHHNLVTDNSGGLLIFDLPGNPVVGRDVWIHDNNIVANNRPNFAVSGTTVSQIPYGTGTFALASRRVEISNNTFANNNTTDIAVLSGLAIASSTAAWAIPLDMVEGSTVGLALPGGGGVIFTFYTSEIWVHDNLHSGSGGSPDSGNQAARPLGTLLGVTYFGGGGLGPVDNLLYDGIGEVVDPSTDSSTNINHICFEDEMDGTLGVLDLPNLAAIAQGGTRLPTTDDITQLADPYTPFDCTGFSFGPIPAITLP
jgi:parallel beta-helix repeat protein